MSVKKNQLNVLAVTSLLGLTVLSYFLVPFDIISYAAGLTTMGFWEFFWTTGVGQLPATLIYSWLGENMSPTAKYAFGAVCGFLVLLVISMAVKKRFAQKLESCSNDN